MIKRRNRIECSIDVVAIHVMDLYKTYMNSVQCPLSFRVVTVCTNLILWFFPRPKWYFISLEFNIMNIFLLKLSEQPTEFERSLHKLYEMNMAAVTLYKWYIKFEIDNWHLKNTYLVNRNIWLRLFSEL